MFRASLVHESLKFRRLRACKDLRWNLYRFKELQNLITPAQNSHTHAGQIDLS